MAVFYIESKAGAPYGYWAGQSQADALAELHRQAGYSVRYDADSDEIVWPDADTAELCGDVKDWTIIAEHERGFPADVKE